MSLLTDEELSAKYASPLLIRCLLCVFELSSLKLTTIKLNQFVSILTSIKVDLQRRIKQYGKGGGPIDENQNV